MSDPRMKAEWNPGEVGDMCTVEVTDSVFGAKEFGVQEALDVLTAEIAKLDAALTTARIDGARAFVDWCDQFEAQGVCYEVKDQFARWLASESKEGK